MNFDYYFVAVVRDYILQDEIIAALVDSDIGVSKPPGREICSSSNVEDLAAYTMLFKLTTSIQDNIKFHNYIVATLEQNGIKMLHSSLMSTDSKGSFSTCGTTLKTEQSINIVCAPLLK